jgi:hypothetical protein
VVCSFHAYALEFIIREELTMLNAAPIIPASKASPVIDDGVTKFKMTLKRSAPLPAQEVVGLEKWRAILWRLRFIGEYQREKVGYGNLSQRLTQPKNAFVITGSQTGRHPHLRREHYTRVVSCDLSRNSVEAQGPIGPSSESLTHFAIYESQPQIHAVFHVHHREIWDKLIQDKAPAIPMGVPYGTREMAEAAARVITGDEGLFVMKGHQDGIIAYGASPEAAGKILLKLYRSLGPTENL